MALSLLILVRLWKLIHSGGIFLMGLGVVYILALRIAVLINTHTPDRQLAFGFWPFFLGGLYSIYRSLRKVLNSTLCNPDDGDVVKNKLDSKEKKNG